MSLKIAINGFGRIGRCVARAIIESERQDMVLVAVNDLAPPDILAHLLRYDSVHAPFAGKIALADNGFDMGAGHVRVSAEKDPARLDWQDIDIALECTGFFTDGEQARAHLENGSKRVLISAPAKNIDRTVVYGVNHDSLTEADVIVSNASCTTNCLAPVAKVIDDAFGLERGYMTTIHSYTGDQPTLDRMHKDFYRARAAALSMIPTGTGAAEAVGAVLPELSGKLSGSAVRVPTANVSCIDLTFVPKKPIDAESVNDAMRKAANSPELKGILAVETEPLVSVDFNHRAESSIFAPDQTRTVGDELVRVLSWYDNEWGFSNRMCDTARAMGALIS